MVLSLIYGKIFGKYPALSVGTITFDNNISEEHHYSSRVTSYPVESGTIVSDHILNLPDTIVITGLVTDTPWNIFATFNRSIDVFNQLVALHQRRQVIQVQTGLKLYRNMAIVNLDIPRTVKTGQTLTFTIELQHIIFSDVFEIQNDPFNILAGSITTRSATIVGNNQVIPTLQNDPPGSLADQASTPVNVGVQSTDAVPPATKSNVYTGLDAIIGGS